MIGLALYKRSYKKKSYGGTSSGRKGFDELSYAKGELSKKGLTYDSLVKDMKTAKDNTWGGRPLSAAVNYAKRQFGVSGKVMDILQRKGDLHKKYWGYGN